MSRSKQALLATAEQSRRLKEDLAYRLHDFDSILYRMRDASPTPEGWLPEPFVTKLAYDIAQLQDCLESIRTWLLAHEDPQYELPDPRWLEREPSINDIPF